jgi:hypothetical protein
VEPAQLATEIVRRCEHKVEELVLKASGRRWHAEVMDEASDPAEWARVMVDRHGVGDVRQLTAEGEAMTVEERAEFQLIFEKLTFIEAMTARWHGAKE